MVSNALLKLLTVSYVSLTFLAKYLHIYLSLDACMNNTVYQ